MDGLQATQPTAGIGHNAPPSDIELLLERLATTHEPLLKRATDLVGALTRVPETITDEATCGKASDFIKQLMVAVKNAESKRVDEKEPFLSGGKAVDGFFDRIKGPLAAAKATVQKRIDAYLNAKAAEERRQREEEARRAAEEARRLEAEALAAANDPVLAPMAEAALDEAVFAETVASEKKHEAEARPADLARTRSDYGSVATLRTVWVGEVADYAAVDLEALRPHLKRDAVEQAIRAFVNAGGRELKGARIFEKSSAVVR